MPPPSATYSFTETEPSNGYNKPDSQPEGTATHETGPTMQRGVKANMQSFPSPPKFTDKYEEREYLKGRLALAFRIFGKEGYDEGVAGHITLRDPVKPDHFWVNPFGVAFSQIKKSDLIMVNHEGKVVDGGPTRLLNQAAYMIHAAVHAARPDVDACAFYNDLAVYNAFRGVVLVKEEGENIAQTLGDKKAILLQNHGLLTVGQTIEACIFWFKSLEKCCQAQLMADAACAGRGGATIKIDDEDAAFTYKAVGTPRAGWFSAKPAFDVMEAECGHEVFN